MFRCARSRPRQDCRFVRSRLVLERELVVQIDRGREDLSRLALVAHRMSALPAEGVLLFDLRSTFSTGSDTRCFFFRSDHRLWFFTFRRSWRRLRWWLDYGRDDGLLLRLLLDYVEHSGRNQRPAVI